MAAAVLLASACSSEQDALQTIAGTTVLNIDGGCNVYEITNSEQSAWQIVECPDWVTPVKTEGAAGDDIKVYVESNSGASLRQGDITIAYQNGKMATTRAEQSNSQPTFNLQRSFAVGWSFDVRTYNDSRGLRDQVFNTQKIYNDNPETYFNDVRAATSIDFYYGTDASELSNDMSGKLNIQGKYNLFSLDLQGSFGKSALNNSKRIFSWIRGLYSEREVYLVGLDLGDAQDYNWFTRDFTDMRNKVISSGGSDESIELLLERYGTHFVISAILGGCYDYYYSTVIDETKDNLNIKAAIQFGYSTKFKLDANGEYATDFSSLNNETIEKFSVKGGDAVTIASAVESGTLTQELTDEWLKTMRDEEKYELLSYELIDISELFPEEIAHKIDTYIEKVYYNEVPLTRSAEQLRK
mgnify:CR=1 FL=1